MPTIEIRMSDEHKEGTQAFVGTWLKQVGEAVAENEPIVEIGTDKVTIEIAAPASGVLVTWFKQAGDEVLPGELLGTIQSDAGDSDSREPESEPPPHNSEDSGTPDPTRLTMAEAHATYSPATRRLLRELGLDPDSIPKTSRGARITPADIGAHLRSAQTQPVANPPSQAPPQSSLPAGRTIPHTPMRRSIASHMTRSVQSAPHVTSVFEADLSRILADRERRKQADPARPTPSVTAYLIHAAIAAIQLVPEVNSKWHDEHLEVFDQVNFGVGTALDTGGLVVPVIRDAHRMDLRALSQALREMTAKARSGKLTHADMEGGTFTLSNHGVSGSLLAAPIILPHGQAAILGAGKLQKRVIVCDTGGRELFRVRPMVYVTLTVDHRVLDGQQTNGFLTAFVQALEKPS